MNVRKMRLIYGGVILISLVVIGFTLSYFYGRLGGYTELVVYDLNSENRVMVGKQFQSRPTDPVFETQYTLCRDMIANKEIRGDLTVQTFYSDSISEKQLDQFIGITLAGDMAEVPTDFEIREIVTGRRFVVFLPMHPLVRPSPREVEAVILNAAQEAGAYLQPFFVEFHYHDNSMAVEAWEKTPPTPELLDSISNEPMDSLLVP